MNYSPEVFVTTPRYYVRGVMGRKHFKRLSTRRKTSHAYSPTSHGCNFCVYGTDPLSGQSICDACVKTFKAMLSSRAWASTRLVHLDEYPLCAKCGQVGDNVHHTKPWRQYPTEFWTAELWETLCQSHHSRHTVASDGGFGRPKKTK